MTQPKYPFQDSELTIAERVEDLIGRMTLAEKIDQLQYDAPAIEHLDVPAYNWWNECLHGVARAGTATVFPQAIGLAAAWNAELIEQIATAIGDEARAKHHAAVREGSRAQYEGLTFWSPNINIFRDPRWGRGQETYGEDPYLTGRMGVAFIRGLQGEDERYLKVIATPKHFAVHSGPEAERHRFNAEVSPQDLWSTYLPAFEACVREGGAASIMGAYNRTNGEPCCASPRLLQEILRERWGFSGYVVSDCGAVADIYQHHEVEETAAAAAAAALRAGCDLECGVTYGALETAVAQGLVGEAEIDRALTRLFTARFHLGMFDPPQQVPYTAIPLTVNNAPEHQNLALAAARQSIVLLKNEDDFLPLSKKVKSVAVIGPSADAESVLLGNYHGAPAQSVTLLNGIRDRVSEKTRLTYAAGWGGDEADKAEAVLAAKQAKVAIVVAGLTPQMEGEELEEGEIGRQDDRVDLELPQEQEEVLRAVYETGTPVVLVLLNGSPLAVNWADEHLPAILEAWYPGEAGGTAVADVLFGDYNPGGRLPVTFYKSQEDLPPFTDYAMAGRTYRYFENEPLYRFGHGLSYTRFVYQNLRLSSEQISTDEALRIEVEVENVGDRAGDEVVQVYVSDMAASTTVPIRQLQGFRRVHLAAGEKTAVSFTLEPAQLAMVDESGRRLLEPGAFELAVGGRQPSYEDFLPNGEAAVLLATFEVKGDVIEIE
jgi:beta-glucosidase